MGHSVHNVDIKKTLAHMTPSHCNLPGIVVNRIHPSRAHFSSVPIAIEGERFPTEVGYDTELQSGQDPGKDDELADELP